MPVIASGAAAPVGDGPASRVRVDHPSDATQSDATAYKDAVAPALLSLIGLRFVAAFLVFGFHMHVMGLLDSGTGGTVLEWIFSQGGGAFSIYFILSGFVLTWSLRPTDTAARFWQRRVARIYPNHAATWLAALGIGLLGGGLSAAVALPNLLLVQAWLPAPRVYFGMTVVGWALACEGFFSALFPLLHRGLLRLPRRALWCAVAASMTVIWLVPLATQPLATPYRYWAIWVFPVARLPEFVSGMLLARIVREARWPASVGVWPATALTAGAYVGSRWLPLELRLVASMAVPLALLIGAIAAADASGRPTRWSWPWLLWLGQLSYAFYLVHHLVLRVVVRLAGSSHSAFTEAALAAAALALALCGSWLLYRCVERPARRLLAPRQVGWRRTLSLVDELAHGRGAYSPGRVGEPPYRPGHPQQQRERRGVGRVVERVNGALDQDRDDLRRDQRGAQMAYLGLLGPAQGDRGQRDAGEVHHGEHGDADDALGHNGVQPLVVEHDAAV